MCTLRQQITLHAGSCAPEDLFYGEQNIMMYHGMAPEAKLAVFDIGEATNDLDVPEDLHSELFPPGHKAGTLLP